MPLTSTEPLTWLAGSMIGLGGVAVVAVAVAAGGERGAGRVGAARRRAVAGGAGHGRGGPGDGAGADAVREVAVAVSVGAGAAGVEEAGKVIRCRSAPAFRRRRWAGRWRGAGWPGWRRCGTRCRRPAWRRLGPPAAPVKRCLAWAPTLAPVERLVASTGGEDEKATALASAPVRAGSPWQVVQVWVVYSIDAVHVSRHVDGDAGVTRVAGAAIGAVRVEAPGRRRRRRHAVAGGADERRGGGPGGRHVGRADAAAQVAVAVGVGAGEGGGGVAGRGDAAGDGEVGEPDRAGRRDAGLVDLGRGNDVAGVAEHRTGAGAEDVGRVDADAAGGGRG